MKQMQMVIPRRPGFGAVVVSRRATLRLLAIGSIAGCVIITCCVTPARATDALPVNAPPDKAALAQEQAYSPQAYQMERYKAFARQTELPVITVTDKTTLEVGGVLKTDIKLPAQPSGTEKEALARQFGVPAEVIVTVLDRASTNQLPNAAQLAQAIRTAVIDYRFLQGEWGRYNPPPEGKQTKAAALLALQAGDISKAWQLYDGLQKPQAPGIASPAAPVNLRVVAQP
jgi:hypothetical protein